MVGSHLDVLMADAWPPLEEERHGAWRFRWTAGVTGRGNSALPIREDGSTEELVDRAEDFYRHRQAPPRFLVSEVSAPARLPAFLAGRGYRPEKSTQMMTATSAAVSERTGSDRPDVRVATHIEDAWFDAYWAVESGRGRTDADAGVYRRVLLAPDRAQRLLAVYEGERAVSTVQGVLDGDWCGIQCVATRPDRRGQGLATALLARLAREAAAAGAGHLYLAVQADNAPAVAVYERAGFEPSHRYEYWTLEARPPTG